MIGATYGLGGSLPAYRISPPSTPVMPNAQFRSLRSGAPMQSSELEILFGANLNLGALSERLELGQAHVVSRFSQPLFLFRLGNRIPSAPVEPLPDLDLAAPFRLSWQAADQGLSPTCIAHSVSACLELATAIRDRKTSRAQDPAPPERLSTRFLYAASRKYKPASEDKGWTEGGTRFQSAIEALRNDGVCTEKEWPNAKEGPAPAAVFGLAAQRKRPQVKDAVSENPGQPLVGPDAEWVAANLRELIIEELKADRPLGLAFPIYETGLGRNNWLDAMLADGTVTFPDGVDSNHDALSGHAVCVTGVRLDDAARGGGWIILRNSAGASFPRRSVGGMTGFGYLRMSLADANLHCWDLFTLRPANVPYEP
jgi:hypothetical protein